MCDYEMNTYRHILKEWGYKLQSCDTVYFAPVWSGGAAAAVACFLAKDNPLDAELQQKARDTLRKFDTRLLGIFRKYVKKHPDFNLDCEPWVE